MKGLYFLLSVIVVLLCFICFFLYNIDVNLYTYLDSLSILELLFDAM